MRGLLERSGIDRSTSLLILLPFATGAGLVVHIVTGVSLLAGVLVLAAIGAILAALYVRSIDTWARQRLARRLGHGILAGVVATVAYDLIRLLISETITTSVNPYAAWPLFGQALTGAARDSTLAVGAGIAYHAVNGIGFAVAYVLVFRRPHVVTGVLWGLGLEFAMALLYPNWLRIEALREFLTMSVVGHIVYGATLGAVAAYFVKKQSTMDGER